MSHKDKSKCAQELALMIIANSTKKALTEESLKLLIAAYFESKSINLADDKIGIIQRALITLHPDRNPLTDKVQVNLIAKTLIEVKENLPRESDNTDKQEMDLSSFTKNLFDSPFKNSETEGLLRYLAKEHTAVLNWVSTKSDTETSIINAPLLFMRLVLKTDQLVLRTTEDMALLLIKISLLEILINKVHPNKPIHKVIEKYCVQDTTYPKECQEDPLLWLMNEIVLDDTRMAMEPQILDNQLIKVELPTFHEINNTKLVFENFSDTESLRELVKKWSPDTYQPHIKALLSHIISFNNTKPESNKFHCARLEIINKELVFKLNEESEKQLVILFKLDNASLGNASGSLSEVIISKSRSHLKNLEDERSYLIYELKRLPAVLFSAKLQLVNLEKSHPVSDFTIYEFLANRLNLFNFLINQERRKGQLVLEDPNYQPTLEKPADKLHFITTSGVIIPYFQPTSIRNDSCRLENVKDEYPHYVSPEAFAIIKKTLELSGMIFDDIFRFSVLSNYKQPQYASLQALFSNCSEYLKNSYESKKFLLMYSAEYLEYLDSDLVTDFSKLVNQYIGVNAAPLTLVEFNDGLKQFQMIKENSGTYNKYRMFQNNNNTNNTLEGPDNSSKSNL